MTTVAAKLIQESDRLGSRVLANWEEERRIEKKVEETKEYRFARLAGGGSRRREVDEEEKVDAREIDALLTEMAQMSGRWELLRRFLYGRLGVSFERFY